MDSKDSERSGTGCIESSLCAILDRIEETDRSIDIENYVKAHLKGLLRHEFVAMLLFDKISLHTVKIVDVDFSADLLYKIVENGKLNQNLSEVSMCRNRFDYADYSFISYGAEDPDRRYISLFCILNSLNSLNLDTAATISALRIIAPHLHAAIVNIYHSDLINQAPDNVLSPRELEVLKWVPKGKTNYEIGVILGISTYTVKNHIANILFKLQVSNRAQALEKAMTLGYFWNHTTSASAGGSVI